MKHIVWLLLAVLVLGACGQSYEEGKRVSRQERAKRMKEDSAALKIAVMPTLDCLPLYVARSYNLYDSLGADIRLKPFTAQMDCDTALVGGSVEGAVTDLVRGQRMVMRGTKLTYVAATDAYWQLLTNRNARISNLKQLLDKMVAMTRYSVTDMMTDYATDSARLERKQVFKVQINDVSVRLDMLLNNEMDAMWLTEPQAAAARQMKHKALMDTRKIDFRPGAIAFRSTVVEDKSRKKQMDVFVKAYNMACDSINKYGTAHYARLIAEYGKVKEDVAMTLGNIMKFSHIAPPRQKDIDIADKWLKTANN